MTAMRACPSLLALLLACTLVLVLVAPACGPAGITMDDEVGDDSDSTESTQPESSESESTASESESTSTESSSTDDGWDFLGDTGCGGEGFRCSGPCEPFAQDCPEGEKCVPYASTGGPLNSHKCVPVLGEQAPGEPCNYDGPLSATDDCDESGVCFGGICQSFCRGSAGNPICDPGLGCAAKPDDKTPTLCLPVCDVLAQDCGDLASCYWLDDEFLCAPTGSTAPGELCVDSYDCVEGGVCLIADILPSCAGERCCASFCNLAAPDCASLPGTECVAFFEDADEGFDDVGVCIVP